MKYLKSLLKYILIVIAFVSLFTLLIVNLPQGQIELTYNQAVIYVVVGIIAIALALKSSFDM